MRRNLFISRTCAYMQGAMQNEGHVSGLLARAVVVQNTQKSCQTIPRSKLCPSICFFKLGTVMNTNSPHTTLFWFGKGFPNFTPQRHALVPLVCRLTFFVSFVLIINCNFTPIHNLAKYGKCHCKKWHNPSTRGIDQHQLRKIPPPRG